LKGQVEDKIVNPLVKWTRILHGMIIFDRPEGPVCNHLSEMIQKKKHKIKLLKFF